MPNVDATQIGVRPVWGACLPSNPVCAPVRLHFTGTDQVLVLPNMIINQVRDLTYIQTLWIDNSANTQPLLISNTDSLQTLDIPAGYQGYAAVAVPNPAQLTFTSLVSVDTDVIVGLLNYPVSNALWPAGSTPVLVSDTVLDTLLANGYLPVLSQGVRTGDVVQALPVADTVAYVSATAAAATAIIAAPANPAAIYLESLELSIGTDATLAVAGEELITVHWGAALSASTRVSVNSLYVGTAALTTADGSLSKGAVFMSPRVIGPPATALNVTLGTALTAGGVRVCARYAVI